MPKSLNTSPLDTGAASPAGLSADLDRDLNMDMDTDKARGRDRERVATGTTTGTGMDVGMGTGLATAPAAAPPTAAGAGLGLGSGPGTAMATATATAMATDVHYTVFIRLPFARGKFVDPPSVEWDAAKDRALWKILSNTPPKRGALNWNEISTRFNVPLPFILQQAAWLYERQLSQVKAQMRKVGGSGGVGGVPNVSTHQSGTTGTPGALSHNSGTAPAVNAASAMGGVQMRRLGSAGSRGAPSSLTGTSKDGNASALNAEKSGSGAGTPQVAGLRRLQTIPTSKVTEAQREASESPRQAGKPGNEHSADTFPDSRVQSEQRTRSPGSRRDPIPSSSLSSSLKREVQSSQSQNSKSASGPLRSYDDDDDLSSNSSSNSSSDSSANYDSATYPVRRSQIFRQPFSSKKRGHGRNQKSSYSDNEDENGSRHDDYDGNADDDDLGEDDDENPTFLPFAQHQQRSGSTKHQQQQQKSSQQDSASITPTATTVRSGTGVAGGSFGRLRQQQRGQGRLQQERMNENSVMSSEGSPLSSSDAASSSYRSLGMVGKSNSASAKNTNATKIITGRENTQARVSESTTSTTTNRLSRRREPEIGQPTQSSTTRTGTQAEPPSKPTTSKSTQPQRHHSSSNSSNSNVSNISNNNANRNKHVNQSPSQNQTRPQSQSQSRNHSQSQPSQPHRTDPASQLSPRQRALRRRENNPGSDGGTPSMGSSFSDLDDTSVTQSALEEALLSNMQHRGAGGSSIGTAVGGGAIASRMSSLSQALRSKYL